MTAPESYSTGIVTQWAYLDGQAAADLHSLLDRDEIPHRIELYIHPNYYQVIYNMSDADLAYAHLLRIKGNDAAQRIS